MRIEPIEPTGGDARIDAYLPADGSTDFAVHEVAGGPRWLVRSRRRGGVRVLDHWELTADGPVALDRVRFELGRAKFAEIGRWQQEGGPNLHQRPIVLPAVLALDEWHKPLPGSRVRLGFVGRARLGDVVVDAIRLDAEEGDRRAVQWLVRDVGEVAVGTWDALTRWCVGWTDGSATLWDGVPVELTSATLPPLARPGGTPASTVL